MRSDKVFFWACDYKSNSGEGRLARLYVKQYKKNSKERLIKLPSPKIKLFKYKYIIPFVGVFYAWSYFFKNKKFLFLNYLPYWNFFLFLILPPKCEIGPITGGAKFSKSSSDYSIRRFFFPLFYFLTNIILIFRFKKLIFSTSLMKNFLPKIILKKSTFNFIFNEINNKKKFNIKKNRKIHFLIYFRKHSNKDYKFMHKFINNLIKKNYNVHVIGNYLNLDGIKNYGFISHKKVVNLLSKTKYSIISSENLFTFFTIDCINNNVKILVDYKIFNSISNYKNNFIKFNFKKNNFKKLKL